MGTGCKITVKFSDSIGSTRRLIAGYLWIGESSRVTGSANGARMLLQRSRMFSREMRIAGFDDELLWAAFQGEKQRQEEHIELIASENYTSPRVHGSPGFGAHQQVCRRLSGQALLRRLRVCRHGRAAGHRPRQGACLVPAMPTCNPTPAHRPMPPFTWRWSNRATPSSA
jgi:hypothetical protein